MLLFLFGTKVQCPKNDTCVRNHKLTKIMPEQNFEQESERASKELIQINSQIRAVHFNGATVPVAVLHALQPQRKQLQHNKQRMYTQ
jgi:hypothetical protein